MDAISKIQRLICRHEWVAVMPKAGPAKYCPKCETQRFVTVKEWLEVFNVRK